MLRRKSVKMSVVLGLSLTLIAGALLSPMSASATRDPEKEQVKALCQSEANQEFFAELFGIKATQGQCKHALKGTDT